MEQPNALVESPVGTPVRKNGPKELMAAFGCPGRPVGVPEYNAFWKSLSDNEKDYYRNADLVSA